MIKKTGMCRPERKHHPSSETMQKILSHFKMVTIWTQKKTLYKQLNTGLNGEPIQIIT